MGRNREIGLSYFPFSVDTFSDIKIRKLIKYQGGKAVTVYALLLCLIYRRGYYMRWDEELPFIVSEQTGFEEAYIQEVIKSCLTLGLFSKELYDEEKVFTSAGIQNRYRDIMSKLRRTVIIDEFSLVSVEEKGINVTEMPINVTENGVNVEETPLKEKESKRKKASTDVDAKKRVSSPSPSESETKSVIVSKNPIQGEKETKCGVQNAVLVKPQAEEEKTQKNVLKPFLSKNRLLTFAENVSDCLDSGLWQESVLMSTGIRSLDWMKAFEDFRAHLVAQGIETEKTRQDFRSHFTNWLRIKKQQNGNERRKEEKMGGNDRPGTANGIGRAAIAPAEVVSSGRGKSVL